MTNRRNVRRMVVSLVALATIWAACRTAPKPQPELAHQLWVGRAGESSAAVYRDGGSCELMLTQVDGGCRVGGSTETHWTSGGVTTSTIADFLDYWVPCPETGALCGLGISCRCELDAGWIEHREHSAPNLAYLEEVASSLPGAGGFPDPLRCRQDEEGPCPVPCPKEVGVPPPAPCYEFHHPAAWKLGECRKANVEFTTAARMFAECDTDSSCEILVQMFGEDCGYWHVMSFDQCMPSDFASKCPVGPICNHGTCGRKRGEDAAGRWDAFSKMVDGP